MLIICIFYNLHYTINQLKILDCKKNQVLKVLIY